MLLLALVFLVTRGATFAAQLRLASFNIGIFSNGSRDDDELGQIVCS